MRKKLLWVASGIVGVLVVATLVIRFLVPADTWKRLALEQFEARTGMQATAESARLEFPWPVGLRLSKVTLDDERPDAAYRSLHVAVDHVVVTAQLMSLVRRKPQVNEIRLVRPEVEVAMRDEPLPPRETAEPAASKPAVAAVLSLIAIEDGQLTVRSKESTLVLNGLDQKASLSLTEAGVFDGRVEGSLESCRVSGTALPAELTLPSLRTALSVTGDLEQKTGRAQVERLELGTLQAEGPVAWSQAGEAWEVTATLDLQGSLMAFEPQLWTFVTLPPELDGQVKVQAASLQGQLSFQGTLPPPTEDPAALWSGLQGRGELQEIRLALYDLAPFTGQGRWHVADGAVQLDPLRIEQAAVTAEGKLTANAENQIRGAWTAQAELRALVDLAKQIWPRLPAATREESLPPEEWPALSGPVVVRAEFDLDAKAELEPLDLPVRLQATWENVGVRPKGWKEDLKLAAGSAHGDLRKLDLKEVSFSGPGFVGRGNGSVGGWPERIACTAQLQLDRLDLDAFQAATKAVETSWWSGPGVKVAYADDEVALPAPPEKLVLDLNARAQSVRTRGYQLTDVTTKGRLEQQRFQIQQAEGMLGTGRVTATGGVDWTLDTPRWDVKTRAEAVPASTLLEPFAALLAGALTANLSGSLDLSGPLNVQTAAILEALTGEGKVQSTTGHLKTEPVWGRRIQEFLGREAGLFRDIDFRELTAGIKVAGGRVEVERAVLSGDTSLGMSGWIGLSGTCDYKLQVMLPPTAQPTMGALEPVVDLLRDDQRRISFQVAVSGATTKPDVRIDTQVLKDRAAAVARQRGETKLGDVLSKELGLDRPDTTQPDLKGQLQDKARGTLEGLLGGKKKGSGGGGR